MASRCTTDRFGDTTHRGFAFVRVMTALSGREYEVHRCACGGDTQDVPVGDTLDLIWAETGTTTRPPASTR